MYNTSVRTKEVINRHDRTMHTSGRKSKVAKTVDLFLSGSNVSPVCYTSETRYRAMTSEVSQSRNSLPIGRRVGDVSAVSYLFILFNTGIASYNKVQ